MHLKPLLHTLQGVWLLNWLLTVFVSILSHRGTTVYGQTESRYMDTPLVQAIIAEGGEEYTRYWKDGSPMNRLGQPEDLQGLVKLSSQG